MTSQNNASNTVEKPPSTIQVVKNRLILHFDVNETILVCDEAGGDTKEDCLNKIIAKNSFVRIPKHSSIEEEKKQTENSSTPNLNKLLRNIKPTHWWDGTPIHSLSDSFDSYSNAQIDVPKLHTSWEWIPGCCPYYRTSLKKNAKCFTRNDGKIYRPLYNKMEKSLLWENTKESPIDKRLCHDGKSHYLLPAFFHTLAELHYQKREFTIVLRTFGNDLSAVAAAISAFATGNHPQYPDINRPDLVLEKKNMFKARWISTLEKSSDKITTENMQCTDTLTYCLYEWSNTNIGEIDPDAKLIVSGDEAVKSFIEKKSVCGIQDEYTFWAKNNNLPQAGKPLWICVDNDGSILNDQNNLHHIFFDDNILNDPYDSIVGVRCKKKNSTKFESISGKEIQQLQGKCLVRVPTIEPILNIDWFLQQIQSCEKSIENNETDRLV